MHRVLPRAAAVAGRAALLAAALLAACGDKKNGGPAPAASSAAPAPASAAAAGTESPLSVIVDARGPLVLSGLAGGVVVADAAHTRWGHAASGGELAVDPMPEGLPEGPGRVLAAAGRLPGPVWLIYEKLREDGKVEANPLFRLSRSTMGAPPPSPREGFKKFADDWRPAIVPWTRHRILAASTSSGKLKIKVIEPSLPSPPADLPSPRLGDASCEQTLKVAGLAALPTGEVLAAGTCKPDTAAGAGPSAARYVVIRWTTGPAPRPSVPLADAGPASADAGPAAQATAALPADAGGGDPGGDDHPGTVDVIPGVSGHLTHEALWARDSKEVWAAAHDPSGKASKLFRFDGATWGAVALPPGTAFVRGLAGTADGSLWMGTDRAILRRTPAGAWEEVPLPSQALPGEGTWEVLDVAAPDGRDVWISARRTVAGTVRHLILRSRPAPAVLRWE